jgi:hypothetical protein
MTVIRQEAIRPCRRGSDIPDVFTLARRVEQLILQVFISFMLVSFRSDPFMLTSLAQWADVTSCLLCLNLRLHSIFRLYHHPSHHSLAVFSYAYSVSMTFLVSESGETTTIATIEPSADFSGPLYGVSECPIVKTLRGYVKTARYQATWGDG